MNLTFFQNKSAPAYVNKSLDHFQYGSDNIVPCKATDGCTISDPIFLLGSSMFDLSNCNYCYCDLFGRFYYIKDCEVLPGGMTRLYCHVDVLMSNAAWVRSLYALVKRQESKNLCNKYIEDNEVITRIDRQIVKKQIGSVGGNATGTHICLTVTGGI